MDQPCSTPPGAVVPFDEMLVDGGQPRATHADMHQTLVSLGAAGLSERARQRDAYLDRHGITFTLGERERPLPMDLVPRLLTPTEWQHIEAGVIQRLHALGVFLADVYGPGHVLDDGLIPRGLVTTSTHFHREAWDRDRQQGAHPRVGHRPHPRRGRRVPCARGHLRNPSGVSYVLENRRTPRTCCPRSLLRTTASDPSMSTRSSLLDALKAAAPPAVRYPTVVVLTPGVHNSAHYEHAFLARHMGVEPGRGARPVLPRQHGLDAHRRPGRSPCMSSTVASTTTSSTRSTCARTASWASPASSMPPAPGASRSPTRIGNGVADDKAVYPYVPALIKYYLNEEPILPNVDTYDLSDPEQREWVLAASTAWW